jgi:hypothetical protein
LNDISFLKNELFPLSLMKVMKPRTGGIVAYNLIYRQMIIDYVSCGEMHAVRRGPLLRVSIIVLTVIFSLLAGTGFSIADEGTVTKPSSLSEPVPTDESTPWPGPVPWPELVPWAEPAPWPGPVPWPEPVPWLEPVPPTIYITAFGRTLDKTHAMLERNILKQAVRFDNFFGSVKPENLRQTKYEIRWRNSIKAEQGSDLKLGTTFRANFTLSKVSERLRLFIAGEDEPGLTTQSLPQDPGNPGFDRTTPTTHFANTELRYELIQNPSLDIFLGAGFRLVLPFEVFARTRLQYVRNVGNISLMRIAETFFVKNTDYLGETTEFSLERLFGGATLLRWASAGTASEEIKGLEWGSELSLFRQFSSKSALTLTGGIYGNTTSSDVFQNYQLVARYRHSFLRSWLFYELEPQIAWPRKFDGSHPAKLAFTFRIEVVFQGTTTN